LTKTTTDEQALVDRVQELTERLEEVGDPDARALADELATAVVQLYGEGLQRIVALLDADALAALAEDEVVASLLLVHELHPVDVDTRVREALDSVRPYLESHGGDIELLGIAEGVARLRLRGSCDGCAASAATLEAAVERAIQDAAPDLLGIDVEGAVAPPPARPAPSAAEWIELDGAAELPRGSLAAVTSALVVANVAGTLLAYRNACAACGNGIESGLLLGGTLTCVSCGRAFDLPRAGRSKDDDGLQLEPVPLLRSNGTVKVALTL
jgi:Fe-S cluster biogenesis protein NfuA/nitrite reductase/ring-hydroxylating ferredoxin subunit